MKQFLFAGCLALSALSGFAQTIQKSYDKSVFRNMPAAQSNDKAITTKQQAHAMFPAWSLSIDKQNGNFTDLYGPGVNIPGKEIADKVSYCLDNQLQAFGLNKAEWLQTGTDATTKAQYAYFHQVINNHSVVFSKLTFRFTTGGNLLRVQMKNYGKPVDGMAPVITSDQAEKAALQDLGNAVITSNKISTDWFWFPVPSQNGYDLHPAWEFHTSGTDENKTPLDLTGYIDAIDGSILYRTNDIKDAYSISVTGTVYKDGTLNPTSVQPLKHLGLMIGTATRYTDTNGIYTDTALLSLPGITKVPLKGLWSQVNNASGNTPFLNDTFSIINTALSYPNIDSATSRAVNAYYHVNRVHDFMKGYYPTFTGMDISLPTNIDLTTGTCNAFYQASNTTINFYAAGGGCYSFADIGDVIYHEYGHGITDKFYKSHGSAGGMQNGALNEGSSDTWSMSITRLPLIGVNAFTTGGIIRRYDQAPVVYPQDITGEVHNDGEIIAGSWWDVSVNIGSVDTMTKLFSDTYYDTPDGPLGTEGTVYHEVLISALMHDDTDGNINNGTPHFIQIVSAFARHGIFLINDAALNHTELSNQPEGTIIPVTASVSTTYAGFLKDLTLYYKTRGTSKYDSVIMTNTGSLNFTAQIPAQNMGTIMDYYFAIHDTIDMPDAYFPAGISPLLAANENNIPYQFGIGLVARDSNTFETPASAWQIGLTTDNASNGRWIQAVPIASYVTISGNQLICQTGADHTSGTGMCLVTGNATSISSSATSADVQNGSTTVLSPVLDLSRYTNAVIEYYRWYTNDRGHNAKVATWQVQIFDTGSTVIHNVDNTHQSDESWRRRIFGVKEYLPNSGQYVQLKFIASNPVNGSLQYNGQGTVEGAVDDFFIFDVDSSIASGVKNIQPQKARIYPNPANNELEIDLKEAGNSGTISLYDLSGRKLNSTDLLQGTLHYTIDTKNIVAGQYFLMIQTNKTIQSQTVIVNH